MKTKNRVISLLLAACMMLSLCAALPFVASAEVVSTSGWDGKTATQPEGSGTKDDPYLIADAANLLWIQKQIPRGDGVNDAHADVAAGKYTAKFAGMYFLQTQDIDLNGKDFASIGYYFANAKRTASFGGTYDGQGFAIRNGKITSQNTGHALNVNWGHGLFGMIHGATIKNIVLDNVQVEGNGITGAIVGRAAATADDKEKGETLNVIENCVVNANCSVTVTIPQKVDVAGASRAGGIVGMAYATTIRYCTNAAKITVPSNWRATGGIVGTYGYNSKIEYCVNTGEIAYGTADDKNTQEVSVGGIAGFIYPSQDGAGSDTALKAASSVSNCYNSGKLTFIGKMGSAFHLGGILGGINSPTKYDGEANDTIENCYNLFAFTFKDHTSLGVKTNNFRVGGILGTAWCSGNANCGTLWIGHSSSVTVDANHYIGTNEYRHQTNKTKYGYYPVEPVMESDVSTVTTKTAEELAPLTKAIDDAITAFNANATAKKVGKVAYQCSTGEDTNAVRFSAQIVGNGYERVGFKVWASYTEGDTVKVSEVRDVVLYTYYTALKADGEDVTPDAGNYFIAFVIDSIPTDKGNVTFTLTPYVVAEGGTSFGNTVSVTFDAAGNEVK